MIPHVIHGRPVDTEGMAGTLTLQVSDAHADFWARDLSVVLIEQDLRPVVPTPYATWFPASRSLLADPDALASGAQWAIDRHLRPWTHGESWKGWPVTLEPFRSVVAARRLHAGLVALWEWIRWPRDKWGTWRRSE